MIDPPIDKLIKKAPCRYALIVGLSKRVKDLFNIEKEKEDENTASIKVVTQAAKEIYEDKILIITEEK